MQLVDNDAFLKELVSLFETSNKKGSSVWLTHKRLTYDGDDAVMEAVDGGESDKKEYTCLVRATDGDKINFSTHVAPGHLEKFHAAYGALLKSSMPTLRKRDKKREKERGERTALRKKRISEPINIEGPKRGKGRRKRQRLMKAALKQEEARKRAQEKTQAS